VLRKSVDSEAVNSIGYDGQHQTLEVEFREGRVYKYLGVPERTYRELMRADSIGRFVATKIKPKFKFSPVVTSIAKARKDRRVSSESRPKPGAGSPSPARRARSGTGR
jgi:hypothetical protein